MAKQDPKKGETLNHAYYTNKDELIDDHKQVLMPCALSIAGLDPGGGAGIAADLRAFHAAGVFGAAALSLTTVQSTDGLKGVFVLPPEQLVSQCEEVIRVQNVKVIKTGALGSAANVTAIAAYLRKIKKEKNIPIIVDPVMVASISTKGTSLLDEEALEVMKTDLISGATLVTANIPEAEALSHLLITDHESMMRAGQKICELGAKAALIKGGHLKPSDDSKKNKKCVDVTVFEDGRVSTISTKWLLIDQVIHGGGCTLASLIAGRIAAGEELPFAIKWAKRKLHRSLINLKNVGGRLRVIDL